MIKENNKNKYFTQNFLRLGGESSGFSLVEIIIYVAMLAILIAAITWSIASILHSYNRMKDERSVENSAMAAIDRMEKEIRNSKSVDLLNTATSTSNGYLTLNDFDSSGTPEIIKFYLLNNRIYVDQNGSELGPLTLENTLVSSLVFRYFSNASSTGIKIEMAIQASSTPVDNFYDSAVLRGSYVK